MTGSYRFWQCEEARNLCCSIRFGTLVINEDVL